MPNPTAAVDKNHPLRKGRPVHEIADRITELAAHLDAGTYRLLVLIAEFDARQGWEGVGMRSCAHWLNWKCGIALGAARERVRVARALPDLPEISAAFRKGEISYSKVRAMTRVATRDNEHALLEVALAGTARHVEQQVRWYRQVKRIEALERDNTRHAQRELSCHRDDDGFWIVKARLTPEQAAIFRSALEAAMDTMREENEDVPAGTSAKVDAPVADPVASRRADALVRLSEAFLGGNSGKLNGGERCQVQVLTDMETLRKCGAGAESEIEGHGNVSAETSRRLACDCSLVKWNQDINYKPMNIGRKSRSVPPSIRRALQRRDGGCRFPGCTCTRFVDAHHVVHWADGGETSLENLVLLCRTHHRLVHEGGFGVEMGANQAPRFTLPDGTTLPQSGQKRSRGNVFALQAQNQKSGLIITPETPVPTWAGEKMDRDMAVEGLVGCEL